MGLPQINVVTFFAAFAFIGLVAGLSVLAPECTELQCGRVSFANNKNVLVHEDGSTESCKSCEQCYKNGFSVCMEKKHVARAFRAEEDQKCACSHSIPDDCRVQNGYNGAFKAIFNICYLPSLKNLPLPIPKNDNVSVIVTVQPFWTEPYWKDLAMNNFSLNFEYVVKDEEECEGEISAGLEKDSLVCTASVDVEMNSGNIPDNTNNEEDSEFFSEQAEPEKENLDDELPPEIQFDRDFFGDAKEAKFWVTVIVKKTRQLALSEGTTNPFKNVNILVSSDKLDFDLESEVYGTEGKIELDDKKQETPEPNDSDSSEEVEEKEQPDEEKQITIVPIIPKKSIEESEETEVDEDKVEIIETTEVPNVDQKDEDSGEDVSEEITTTKVPTTVEVKETTDNSIPVDSSESVETTDEPTELDPTHEAPAFNGTSSYSDYILESYYYYSSSYPLTNIIMLLIFVVCLAILLITCCYKLTNCCSSSTRGDYNKVNNAESLNSSRNNNQDLLIHNKCNEPLLNNNGVRSERKQYGNVAKLVKLEGNNSDESMDTLNRSNTLRLKQVYLKQYRELIGSAPTLDYKRLRLDNIIGDGNFGVVIRQADLQHLEQAGKSEEVIACSSHKFEKFHTYELESFLNALAVSIRAKSHPNIICLLAVDEQHENLLLIFENFNHPDLLTVLRDNRRPKFAGDKYAAGLSPLQLIRIMSDCAKGTGHLIKSRILHSMLAACSVIVYPNGTAKIGGFGFAEQRQLHVNQYEPVSPDRWQSPEILIPKVYKDSNSKIAQSMIWSLGVLLWETASLGGTPFETLVTNEEFLSAVSIQKAMLTMPAHCSVELLSIFHTCVQYDLVLRPDSTEAIIRKLDSLANDPDNHINLVITNPGELFYFPPIITKLEQITARF
uniref:Protein kinase domain-containing protein n=1 Tax=Rhabditophanes sp. KR3021 TaxID=114890 RepID=A0AC35UDC5_9BILA